MKLCIIIPLFCFVVTISFGQNVTVDSLTAIPQEEKFAEEYRAVDSLQSAFYASTDSLKASYGRKLGKLDSAKSIWQGRLDSLTSLSFSSNTLSNHRIDSIQSGFKNKIDSLTSINESASKITRTLDSLNQLRGSTLSELDMKVKKLKEKTVGKLNDLKLPSQLLGKVADVTTKIDGFQIPAGDLNIPAMGVGKSGMESLGGLDIQSPLGDAAIPGMEGLKGIGEETGRISDVTGKVGEYGKDVQGVVKGDLSEVKNIPGAAESKAEDLSGMNEVKDQTKVLDEYKDIAGSMQNPDSLKELAIQEAKQVAVNHFAGKEQQLKEAMETLAKYKSKYSSLNSLSEATKRPPNEMKGKPFIERLVPGVGIQIQKKGGDVLVDFNPDAGYRFTGRITAGIGWNQRVAYNFDNGIFNAQAKIYGPRTFGEFKLWKGFSPRVEVEVMNTNVPPITRTPTVDPFQREWVWGAFVGVKKEYKFIKNVKGTALVMMRLFNPDHKSPYADVVNVRFGFEFPMKKKKD
ncbi:hypothetical protein [Chryseolinea sp. H1M3-3]|uniref:hypothetical protein n=1 Tax=Chryseolinea sp. H1M3-3 TaxID=3034144 RepID=UPI0023EC9732|nr:hypothetical protein [Chryseolinea sp. H1M3-3]